MTRLSSCAFPHRETASRESSDRGGRIEVRPAGGTRSTIAANGIEGRTMVRLHRWGAGLIVAMSLGCGALAPEPRVCTAQFVYGLQVTVLDSVTRAPAGRTALVVAR